MVCQFAENPLLIKAAPKTVCQHKNLILQAWHDSVLSWHFRPAQIRIYVDRSGDKPTARPHIPRSAQRNRSEFSDERSDRGRAW